MSPILERLQGERQRALEAVDEITNAAEGSDRDLSDAELELIQRHRHRVDDELDPQIEQLEAIEVSRARHQAVVATLPDATPVRTVAPTEPGGEVIYRTYAQYARDELIARFPATIGASVGPQIRDAAVERLSRAAPAGSTLTTDLPGLIQPQHLAQI